MLSTAALLIGGWWWTNASVTHLEEWIHSLLFVEIMKVKTHFYNWNIELVCCTRSRPGCMSVDNRTHQYHLSVSMFRALPCCYISLAPKPLHKKTLSTSQNLFASDQLWWLAGEHRLIETLQRYIASLTRRFSCHKHQPKCSEYFLKLYLEFNSTFWNWGTEGVMLPALQSCHKNSHFSLQDFFYLRLRRRRTVHSSCTPRWNYSSCQLSVAALKEA